MSRNIDVVVIGGGYAGVLAANRLTQRRDVAVTVVNPRAVFVERVRLHQVVGGSHQGVVDYRQVLGERVGLVVDTATRIDAGARSVALASGGTVGYDYLIYAVGSASAAPHVPGAAEFAYPVGTLEEARRLREAVGAAPAAAAVTVVGGGSTGIEIAAELADQGRRVTLVCGGVLGPSLHPRVRRAVARRLARLGVTVLDGPDAKVTAVTRDDVRLRGGNALPSSVTIWTTGFGVPDLAARSGLTTDASGRLLTDETLTSVDDARIVAAGDAAAPSDRPLRMSCQTARPLGAHAADTVLARIVGEQPTVIDVGYFGQCIALGRRAATVQLAAKDDTVNRYSIGGRLAAGIKERACQGVVKELEEEAREPGSFRWQFKDTTRRGLLRAEHRATPAAP
ncbi:NAD(P)/FAD-dependent oxidoreductase [Streptomyces cinerochromogenes]|uniref:NAD(P)/FAD-dependent oxidoreductase n=1 Tax=Streptomyces cinerochromogenes TaxID=66422 RepID=UPI001670B26D|nr:FAD-dependent oxidoreductase [Streptomyces cinerochromogenes]GGS55342.1 NADH dehydrogenase [Streptomyces cinerochromogenes]